MQDAGPDSPETPPRAGAARREARLETPRLARELRTLDAMLRLHCADHHHAAPRSAELDLCADCATLLSYARKRLAACPFGTDKPTCANCQVHCYGPAQREAVRGIMRCAGPRMLFRHPILALMHLADGRRAAPPRPRAAASGQPASDTPTSRPAK
jgi:hypothetical protein